MFLHSFYKSVKIRLKLCTSTTVKKEEARVLAILCVTSKPRTVSSL